MPPVTPQPPTLPVTVEVPSPPSITKERSSQLQQPSPTLSQKRTFSLRDRGKNPLTLEVGEQGQEIFFLKNALETHKSNVTYSRKLPVLGDLETIFPRTRCIPVIPSVQLFLGEQTYSVIPIEADSNFCATPISSQFSKITIHSNTVFNFTLTEDLHHNNETDH